MKRPDDFRHVILTRLAVRLDADSAPPDRAWLQHRLRWFASVCLPSVDRQTARGVRWLCFADAAVDQASATEIEELADRTGSFEPIWVNSALDRTAVNAAIDPSAGERILTTRLDCDDALGPDFVRRVHRAATHRAGRYFLNFPLGYQFAAGRFFLRPSLANPFVSLVETATSSGIDGVYVVQHHESGTSSRLVQVMSRPAWLQVVHDRNVANEVRGIQVRGLRVARDFGIPDDWITQDSCLRLAA